MLTFPPFDRKSAAGLSMVAYQLLMSLLDNTPAFHSFQPSMIGMAVWSICRSIHSLLPSTCVFCRNHPVAPELPGVVLFTWTVFKYSNDTRGVSVSPIASSAMAH